MKIRQLLCSALFLLLVGCSQNVKTGGVVTFSDGTPLDQGMVTATDGSSSYRGKIGSDGRFRLGRLKDGDGIPQGNYRVYLSVNWTEYVASAEDVRFDEDLASDAEVRKAWKKGEEKKITHLLIDPKYENADSSGLSVEVKRGMAPMSIVVDRAK